MHSLSADCPRASSIESCLTNLRGLLVAVIRQECRAFSPFNKTAEPKEYFNLF